MFVLLASVILQQPPFRRDTFPCCVISHTIDSAHLLGVSNLMMTKIVDEVRLMKGAFVPAIVGSTACVGDVSKMSFSADV